jgi:hypothetical protein
MKRKITNPFPGTNFPSAGSEPRIYQHDEGLCDVIGQAKDIRINAFVYRHDNAALAVLKFFEASLPGRPSMVGKQICSPINLLAENPTIAQVSGPFCCRVEVVLEIDSTGAQSEVQLDLGLTLIIEE